MLPPIVRIAASTDEKMTILGPSFMRAYPVTETSLFDRLLGTIDEAGGNPSGQQPSSDQGRPRKGGGEVG